MKRMIEKGLRLTASTAVLTAAAASYPGLAYAAPSWFPTIGPKFDSLAEIIQVFFNTAIIFAAIVAVAFLILNGFKYMAAAGDTSKTEEAQKGIANALIGLVIAIIAAIIVNYVLSILGMTPTELNG